MRHNLLVAAVIGLLLLIVILICLPLVWHVPSKTSAPTEEHTSGELPEPVEPESEPESFEE